jgi:hypothetical protein
MSESSLGVSSLNFFPLSNDYVGADFTHRTAKISSKNPGSKIKNIRESINSAQSFYGHKFNRKLFIGFVSSYEFASESTLRYGIENTRRYDTKGLINPAFFLNTRMREQSFNRGLVDLFVKYLPYWGIRRIGDHDSNRNSGRSVLEVTLSHGLQEGSWEFRSSLHAGIFGRGREKNIELERSANLTSYNTYGMSFFSQRKVEHHLYVLGGVGVTYQGTEKIKERKYKCKKYKEYVKSKNP